MSLEDNTSKNAPGQSFTDTVVNGLSANKQITLEKLCDVTEGTQSYPILSARSEFSDTSKPTVFLSAGIHGDEPAGVHAIIQFLNNHAHRYTDRFNFFALPCLNPGGFDAGRHNTASDVNINNQFGTQSEDAVVRAIEAKVKSLAPSVLLSFDLHEDNSGEGRGCYVYEAISKRTNRIAHRVLQVLAPVDICKTPIIYGEENNNGVIEHRVDESQTTSAGLHGYLKKHGAQHVMVIETPTLWPLEKRIQTHLAMICRGLESI